MRKHRTCIKTGILSGFLLLLIITHSQAQQYKPVKVRAFYDTSSVPELFFKTPIGFVFTLPGHKEMATRGFLHGKLRWKQLEITSPQGTVYKGMLHFDAKKVRDNGHTVTFHIAFADTTLVCRLALPYLQSIRFNLYADSLKRGVPYYLNIEGHFSNGKTYPLDTGRIRFYASAGRLDKNILLLEEADTLVEDIFVKGIFKWDPELADSCRIPVKSRIENVKLPTEKELMQRWKNERRRK